MGGAASCPPKNARPNVDSVAINRHRYSFSRRRLGYHEKNCSEKLQALINDADVDVALVKAESGAGKSTLVASTRRSDAISAKNGLDSHVLLVRLKEAL